ncbi:hypothetical protein [Pseudoalteromonas sp. SWXJZ10B]|uniref:hypothetical protein n=1 Tax=Pseudoalteromonas sp. SWXJZ10B TaxID=2792063 RepID=UPI0018CE30D4|nr:hypothetical protein [Pseudoalteromonas sp. SWXJZ10B]MBH0041850.1 hypothetical protein [Pseudoalteromonas sp. SWXJZ10B]
MFFEQRDNNLSMQNFVVNAITCKNEIQNQDSSVNLYLNDTLSIFQAAPKKWDNDCILSINEIGEKFVEAILELQPPFHKDPDLSEKLELIFKYSMKFLSERDFKNSLSDTQHLSINEERLNKVVDNIDAYINHNEVSKSLKKYLRNIKYSSAYEITKDLYHSKEINLFSSFQEEHNKAKNTLQDLENQSKSVKEDLIKHHSLLEQRETKVNDLKNILEQQADAFNFVGLYKGFNDLAKAKSIEAKNLFSGLLGMGVLITIPLLCSIFNWLPENITQSKEPLTHLAKLLPIISLEIIFIYFFRVILQNYKSVKAQILQIELRKTLCQFIQKYAEYSKEIRANDDMNILDKFENLIFSGIISDAENLPSTFDGMDQIGKLLSSLKK